MTNSKHHINKNLFILILTLFLDFLGFGTTCAYLGLLVAITVMVLLLLIPGKEIYLFFILPFIAISQGAATPNITTIISDSVWPGEQGEILGVNQSVQTLSFTIPPMAGFVSALNIRLPIIIGSIFIFASWLFFIISFKKVSL
ncbi:MAG: hypothetical protein C0417_05970 [Chlorobiaceae bacterium]|nr:hypothetical protein [Chlorobiaceae bacterium]